MAVIRLPIKSMTLDEVIGADLQVSVECQEADCRAKTPVGPTFFAARRRGTATLTQLAARVHCMACGSGNIVLRPLPKR